MLYYSCLFYQHYSGHNRWTPAVILFVLIWTTFSASGLAALWAGLGRAHWFIRMAIAVGVIALPWAVSAHELVVIFFFQFTLTTLPLLAYRKFRRPSVLDESSTGMTTALGRSQFVLQDLFLVTTLLAMLLAATTQVPGKTWSEAGAMTCFAATASVISLLGSLLALGRRRWRLQWIAVFLLFPSFLIVAFLYCARAGGFVSDGMAKSTWGRQLATGSVLVLALLLLLPPGVAIAILLAPPSIPMARPLPDPNGWDSLTRVGKRLQDIDVPEGLNDPDALEFFVCQCRQTLDEARATLQGPCQRSLHYDLSDIGIDDLEARNLARAFVARGLLAHLKKMPSEVVPTFSDIFRLGTVSQREGLEIHMFVGWTCDHIGISGLAEIRSELTPDQCRELIAFLLEIKEQWEPFVDAQTREQAWQDCTVPWLVRLFSRIALSLKSEPRQRYLDDGNRLHEARFNLLLTELALRCYRLEHRRVPRSLDELVPKYLPAVSPDPFSGKALVYRLTPQGYLLYSVGPNGKDDGGKLPWYKDDCGDLVLDEPKEEEEP